jgi:molybdopterin-guanine dinucleotide biosynthesis protein
MKQVSAQDILDITMAGTSATLLARRWESALLVNVDNDTLQRLMDNKEALAALMNIEGFRSLNQDIQTIINKSEKVKKAKKEDKELTKKEKKELSDEEKEYKSLRKQIQEKLIKFATRVPIFMYLTDYRERCLKDVITQLEPGLFKKVTGLDVKDFEMLCSIGVFNAGLMNDAIFKFKRYEDSSLSYTGINRHEGEDIGGWDTVIKREEYERLFYNQQATMEAPKEVPTFTVVAPEPEKKIVAAAPVAPKPQPKPQPKPEEKKPNLVTATYGIKPPVAPAKPKVEEPQAPAFDYSKVQEGVTVNHKAFGDGTVSWIDKARKYIRVQFSIGEKMFTMETAFVQGFLTLK